MTGGRGPAGAGTRLALAGGAVLLAAADTYVVVLVLTSIMGDVGVPIDELQRATPIISGFLLGYVVVLPLLGRLSDVYGREPVLIACLVLFALGSMVTAAASSLPVVVAGRTAQGLGGGGLVPVTLAMVADMWPPDRRGLPLGVVGGVQELGSVLGPLYGSALVAISGWRAIFWVNVPIALGVGAAFAIVRPAAAGDATSVRPAAAADATPVRPAAAEGVTSVRPAAAHGAASGRPATRGAAALLLLAPAAAATVLAISPPHALESSDTLGQLYGPVAGGSGLTTPVALAAMALWLGAGAAVALRPPARGATRRARLRAFWRAVDWPGAVLLGGVLACVILSFATADPEREFVAGDAAVLLPAAALLAAAFVARERHARDPLVQLATLRARAPAGALLVNLAAGAALMAALVDIPFFARTTVSPTSQTGAALELVRFLVAVPVGAVIGGAVCDRASYRLTAAAGLALSAASFAVMTRWGADAMSPRVGPADLELALCGLGFGLAIAPVNAAILGSVRAELHGLASALVVVARMIGMLAGLSLLTAIGLRRFHEVSATIRSPLTLCPRTPTACPAYDTLITAAAIDELHTIFLGAAVSAAVAACLAAATLRRPPGLRAAEHGVLRRLTDAVS